MTFIGLKQAVYRINENELVREFALLEAQAAAALGVMGFRDALANDSTRSPAERMDFSREHWLQAIHTPPSRGSEQSDRRDDQFRRPFGQPYAQTSSEPHARKRGENPEWARYGLRPMASTSTGRGSFWGLYPPPEAVTKSKWGPRPLDDDGGRRLFALVTRGRAFRE